MLMKYIRCLIFNRVPCTALINTEGYLSMKLKSIFFLFALTSMVSLHGFSQKRILINSQAGKAMSGLHAFWLKKLSEDMQKECAENKRCEELTQHMSNVVAQVLKRPESADLAVSLKKIEKNNADPEDILRAALALETYGQATIENNSLTVLEGKEPTAEFPFIFLFIPELKEVTNAVEAVGKKSNWSAEKIEQEKKHITKTLEEFLASRKK